MIGRRAVLLLWLAMAGALARPAGAEVPAATFVGLVTPQFDPSVPCLTEAQEKAIRARIDANRALLAARGELIRPAPDAGPVSVAFGWPLRLHPVIDDPGYHAVANYVDHDPAQGFRLDYQCGARTYDQPGYNHAGIDFVSWPFGWLRMDRDEVQIVAAAAGQILDKVDGNFDRNCTFGNNNWNAVYVGHADGSQAWYGHMKNGSTTAKPVGAMVAQGEVLGVVGSSGNSTGPHLHFQVFDAEFHLIDPYAGPCNFLNPTSWWANQRPYNDSAVNALRTHDTPAEFPGCPGTEIPHEQNAFWPGSQIYFAAYYRDQLAGQVGNYAVYDAGGTLRFQWTHSSPQPYYAASLWYWRITAPMSGAAFGNWRFEVTFQGVTTTHWFWIGSLVGVPDPGPSVPRLELAVRGPNPIRGRVEFEASLPRSGVLHLSLLDARGRMVARLAESWRPAGRHMFSWEPDVPAGVYLARLSEADGSQVTRKLVVAP